MIRAGQKLEEERNRKGLSLGKISSATKIKEEFLAAIEKGDYDKLPSSSYAQGFVRSYARFLELSEKDILALFRREFAGEKELEVLPEGLSRSKGLPLRKFRIRQVFLVAFVILIFLIGYIAFQYRYAFINPQLSISSPKEMGVLSSSTVTVEGNTDTGAIVSVGDEEVSVDENGNFKKEIVIFPGKTTITVKSVNRFGRQTSIDRHVIIK